MKDFWKQILFTFLMFGMQMSFIIMLANSNEFWPPILSSFIFAFICGIVWHLLKYNTKEK